MSQKYSPVNVQHVNPFLLSAAQVFRTVLSCELKRGALFLKGTVQPNHEISGVIGLSGKAAGTVVLSLSREVALKATEVMTGETPTELNADVVDAVGELTNMIAGNAKAQLEQYEMSISLPSVIIGHNHSVAFPRNTVPLGIPFDCSWGSVCLDVGLCEIVL